MNSRPDDDGDAQRPEYGKLLAQHQISRKQQGFVDDTLDDDSDNSKKRKNQEAEKEDSQDDEDHAPANEKGTAGHNKRRRSEPSQAHHKPPREKHYVHHHYHDYSGLSGGPVVLPPLPKKGRGGVSSMFPTVLHHMLDDAEKLGFSHIVSWQPHGRAFHVHKPERFVEEVMTKYFRHTRLSSFQRQLSLYGFTRLARKGPDRGAYYHECFLRGMMHLCSNMQRTRVKGTMVRQSSSPESEPDFSALPPVGVNGSNNSVSRPFSGSAETIYDRIAATRTNRGMVCTNEEGGTSAMSNHTAERGGHSADSGPKYSGMPQLLSTSEPTSPPLVNCPGNIQTIDDQHLKSRPLVMEQRQQQLQNTKDCIQPGRPRGTKFMRHLLALDRTAEEMGQTSVDQRLTDATIANLMRQPHAKSPVDGGESQSSSADSKTQNSAGDSKTRKVDADLAVFLQEVDLESDEDECLESEEAMARILEQDVCQISEV